MANKTTSAKRNTTKTSASKKSTATKKQTTKKGTKPKTTAKNVTVEAEVVDVAKAEAIKEIFLWIFLAVCVLLFLSNLGIGGIVGNAVSSFFFGIFGLVAYLFPILLLVATFFGISNQGNRIATIKLIAGGVLTVFLSVLVELFAHGDAPYAAMRAFYYGRESKAGGGLLGGMIASGLVEGFGLISAYVLTFVIMIVCLILITERSLLQQAGSRRRRKKRRYADPNEDREARLARIRADKKRQAAAGQVDENAPRRDRKISGVAFDTKMEPEIQAVQASSDEVEQVHMAPQKDVEVKNVKRVPLSSKCTGSASVIGLDEDKPVETVKAESVRPSRRINLSTPSVANVTTEAPKAENDPVRPTSPVQPQRQAVMPSTPEVVRAEEKETAAPTAAEAVAPPEKRPRKTAASMQETRKSADQVADEIAKSKQETKPAAAYKFPTLSLLKKKAASGNGNSKAELEATADKLEQTLRKSKVTFCAGRDIAGNVITANIAKMPHLLIAGTTGSGKSVCINTIIMSILYKARPDEVKFIMIDPKVVELSIYNGIPHLLIPVVTDPKKAAGALHWAVTEMDDRSQKFADASVRDIKSYNKKLEEHNYQLPINSNGELGTFEKMPEMVVIVDELADLMMVAAKEVEESICRLAQKARAAGIYLILATQRPSVDVVTGLIKANMPSRIAFAVNSGVDSRTILDMFGAEKLLGNGDMLYYPQGYTKPLRVQGAFVSDEEVQDVVDYIKGNNEEASYDENVTKHIESGADGSDGATAIGGGSGFEDTRDSYFAEAGRLIVSKEKGSIGMLQRNFKIGFNRAARIMDQLEEAGVVGPEMGTKPRTVHMTPTQFEQFLNPSAVSAVEEEYPVSDDF